jgi:hypothetical protein
VKSSGGTQRVLDGYMCAPQQAWEHIELMFGRHTPPRAAAQGNPPLPRLKTELGAAKAAHLPSLSHSPAKHIIRHCKRCTSCSLRHSYSSLFLRLCILLWSCTLKLADRHQLRTWVQATRKLSRVYLKKP